MSDTVQAAAPSPFSQSQDAGHLTAMVRYLDFADESDGCARFRSDVLHRLAQQPIGTVLEVGCGTGTLTQQMAQAFPEAIFDGTDVSDPLIDIAKSRHGGTPNCRFSVAAGEKLPWQTHAFDAVVIERVLQHCADPAGIVRECARVLKSGGQLIVCEPDWSGLQFERLPGDVHPGILRGYLAAFMSPTVGRDLRSLISDQGLDCMAVQPDAWQVAYPASARILGLQRLVELAVAAGVPGPVAQAFEARFHDTRAGIALPFYTAVGRAGPGGTDP
jgi:ubiquinone/menaquinone biosynthesis C-methylase UbiE